MGDTVGERMARIEEKLDGLITALAKADVDDEREKDELGRRIDHQGERFGRRLDAAAQEREVLRQSIAANRDEIAKWKNRAFGLAVGASIGTGGVTAAVIKLIGG